MLVTNNHTTHCTLEAYNFCKQNGIIVLTLPPHGTDNIQPLDVAFFHPLKVAYYAECDKFLKNYPCECITSYRLAELFNNAFMRVANSEKAIKGIKTIGLYPQNEDAFRDEDFLPSDTLIVNTANDIEEKNANPMDEENETTPKTTQNKVRWDKSGYGARA